MRKLLALMVLFCCAASTDAAVLQKWCAKDGTVITQTGEIFVLNGAPVDVGADEGEGGIVEFFYLDGKFFAPCGAGSAEAAVAQKWCSNGFEAPAILYTGERLALQIGDKTEPLEYAGTIINGSSGVLVRGRNGQEALIEAEVTDYIDPNKPEVTPIQLFRDRVFWPCDDKDQAPRPGKSNPIKK